MKQLLMLSVKFSLHFIDANMVTTKNNFLVDGQLIIAHPH
jgi:hypothetical protein